MGSIFFWNCTAFVVSRIKHMRLVHLEKRESKTLNLVKMIKWQAAPKSKSLSPEVKRRGSKQGEGEGPLLALPSTDYIVLRTST
jgi:hypothetical protein